MVFETSIVVATRPVVGSRVYTVSTDDVVDDFE